MNTLLPQPNVLLKRARLELGLSQEDLASRLGVSPRTVWRWEKGLSRPYPYHCLLLCRLFQRSAEQLGIVWDGFEADTISPSDSLSSSWLEQCCANPQYQHEYQDYIQRRERLLTHCHGVVQFIDWFLAAHPEKITEEGGPTAEAFNRPA